MLEPICQMTYGIVFYASANVVDGGLMFPDTGVFVRACVRACVSPEQILLARYFDIC